MGGGEWRPSLLGALNDLPFSHVECNSELIYVLFLFQ